jgi:hypothetical protein
MAMGDASRAESAVYVTPLQQGASQRPCKAAQHGDFGWSRDHSRVTAAGRVLGQNCTPCLHLHSGPRTSTLPHAP